MSRTSGLRLGDIGTKAEWVAALRVFVLSGVPKGEGVSTEDREEPPLMAKTPALTAFAPRGWVGESGMLLPRRA